MIAQKERKVTVRISYLVDIIVLVRKPTNAVPNQNHNDKGTTKFAQEAAEDTNNYEELYTVIRVATTLEPDQLFVTAVMAMKRSHDLLHLQTI